MLIILFWLVAFRQIAFTEGSPLCEDSKAPLEQCVDDLISRLTQKEKSSLLGDTGFTTQPIPRLGMPAMAMADARDYQSQI